MRDLLDTHVPDGVDAELSVEGDEEAVRPAESRRTWC